MRGRDRQVHDDLDVRMREDVLGGAGGGHAELRGAGRRGLGEQVPDDVDLHVREGREMGEVLGGDGAGADEADADGAGGLLGHGGAFRGACWGRSAAGEECRGRR
jgi:hypothetical protein